ncbi:MAG: peptide chain release factor N(5)-glutamine methyltransferase [Candidatus Altimarinota bacterium]
MKLKEIWQLAKTRHSDDLAIEVWLGYVLGKSKEFLFLNPELELSEAEVEKIERGLQKLEEGVPLAYLTGMKEFYGMELKVGPQVLIPRPESEQIVDLVKEIVEVEKWEDRELPVLDVGTGSGNIILAIVAQLKMVRGMGTDMSDQALEMAQENARNLKLSERVEFRKMDLLEGMEGEFPIIVTNLPYIGTEKYNFVAKDTLQNEPHLALFGGSDGLDLYRKLFQQIVGLSVKPKYLLGEFGFGQAEVMEEIIKQNFQPLGVEWQILDDLAGIPRIFKLKF